MYQLVFKGECAQGIDLRTARANAQALFKASLDQVDRMFSGQPVVIRNKLDQAQAEKYRQVLQKHGMVAHVQVMPGTRPEPETPAQPARAQAPEAPTPQPLPQSTQRTAQPASSGGGLRVEPGDRLPVAGEKVDSILASSGLALDPVGVTLAESEDVAPPMFQHLDDWTLAPAGSDLGEKRDLPPPMVPDVSHLSLADDNDKR